MLTQEQKQEIVDKYGKNKNDTGSAKVQVALLTARISDLTGHFKKHPKDHTSRRGLLKLVGDRRRFINYIKSNDIQEYRNLIEALNIRK